MAHLNKRAYSALKNIENKEYRSLNSTSRVFCRQARMRQKTFYATEKKALLAIRFGNGDLVRPYECATCMGWHTTSKTKTEYLTNKAFFEA